MRSLASLSAILLTLMLACSGPEPAPPDDRGLGLSPSAQVATTESLIADLEAPRHPADGGGRAWLAAGAPTTVTASSSATFPITFEVGPEGIEPGGMIVLMPSPFWGWSSPQIADERRSGYTTVSSDAEGLELAPRQLESQLLALVVGGRALAPGERVELVYGAGPAGAVVDRYRERASRLWIAVDGDGDGVRQVLADSPAVAVAAGPPARMVAHLPSVARPGDEVRLVIAILDAAGNGWPAFAGTLELTADEAPPGLPTRVELTADQRGRAEVLFTAPEHGVVRVTVHGPGGLEATSNPLTISAAAPAIYWADLHGHSSLSDGTGTPEDYLRYAADIAALDIVALTDHDHWGVLFLDQRPELWQRIRDATAAAHRPGRFVTLLGYEWTNWLHGHRHVLYFSDSGEVLSSVDERWDTPDELWTGLAGRHALTFAHHSAGGPVATNWDYPPDPELEPCTEVVSVHGSSEAADSPSSIYRPVAGNFVRDVLARGYRLGFVGSGDGHDGHPGLAHLGAPSGGVAAILADELTRDGVHRALRARHVYATNGPRIVLRFGLAGHPMGSTIPAPTDGTAVAVVMVEGTAPLDRVELIGDAGILHSAAGEGRLGGNLTAEIDGLGPGGWVYARVVQNDGGAAWSSPIFVD